MSEQGPQSAGDRHWGQFPVFSQDSVIGIGIVFFLCSNYHFFKRPDKKKECF